MGLVKYPSETFEFTDTDGRTYTARVFKHDRVPAGKKAGYRPVEDVDPSKPAPIKDDIRQRFAIDVSDGAHFDIYLPDGSTFEYAAARAFRVWQAQGKGS